MQGVLTPTIKLSSFGSLGGLPSPHFGSVNLILTHSQSRVAKILQTQKSYLVFSILKTLGTIKLNSCSIGTNVTKILKNPMDQLRAPFLTPPKTQPSKVLPNIKKNSTSSHQDLHKSPSIIEFFVTNIGFAISI